MDVPTRDIAGERHAKLLERSIHELEDKVRESEHELSTVSGIIRFLTTPYHAKALLLQLFDAFYPTPPAPESEMDLREVMRAAYDDLLKTDVFLPFRESVLPALLALRKTHQTIVESRAYLQSQGASLEKAKRELESERSNLEDQRLITKSLENRIQSLRDELDSRMELTPEQVAKERLDELKEKKKRYDRERAKLSKSLITFIDGHLGAMLAAEELGGPVVSDLMDIDSESLAAGFSAQGKLKKTKPNSNEDKRQRRIDDIWGQGGGQTGKGSGGWDEADAAGREMRQLTEQLLNSRIKANEESSTEYVKLAKESAAVRFLVRSKVAQFHPKDSTRLRLVDFGREVDD
jgi:hypothetical protein